MKNTNQFQLTPLEKLKPLTQIPKLKLHPISAFSSSMPPPFDCILPSMRYVSNSASEKLTVIHINKMIVHQNNWKQRIVHIHDKL